MDKAAKKERHKQMQQAHKRGTKQAQHTAHHQQEQQQHKRHPNPSGASIRTSAGRKETGEEPSAHADEANEEGEGGRKVPRSGVARVIAAHDRLREARIMQVSGWASDEVDRWVGWWVGR